MINEPKTYLFFLLMACLGFAIVTISLYLLAIIEVAAFVFEILSLGDVGG